MTTFSLKIIAIIAMLIDHVGALFFTHNMTLRIIGRLTMPIMCFFIGEGYRHTSNVNKYISRLFLFAIISEPFFDYGFAGEIYWYNQNVFFTLALGLVCIYIYDKNKWAGLLAVCVLGYVADAIYCDYGLYGVLLVVSMYALGSTKLGLFAALAITTLMFNPIGSIQSYAIFAIVPLAFYNGKLGPKMKYLFYIFYPAHLLALGLIFNFIVYP